MEIPLELRHALQSGSATLFLGAGIAQNVSGSDGQPGLTGRTLAQALATKFGVDITADADLAQVAQVVEARHGRQTLDDFLKGQLSNLTPDASLVWLITRTWKAIYTTNYDRVIQRAFELEDNPMQTPITIATTQDLTPCSSTS
jgi:hypothetical protein